jgi:hypothetical protein
MSRKQWQIPRKPIQISKPNFGGDHPSYTWPDWLKHFLAVIRLNHQLVEQKNRIDGRTVHLQQL